MDLVSEVVRPSLQLLEGQDHRVVLDSDGGGAALGVLAKTVDEAVGVWHNAGTSLKLEVVHQGGFWAHLERPILIHHSAWTVCVETGCVRKIERAPTDKDGVRSP